MAKGFEWGTEIGSDGQQTGKIICYPSNVKSHQVIDNDSFLLCTSK